MKFYQSQNNNRYDNNSLQVIYDHNNKL